jgi:hypothetical protein
VNQSPTALNPWDTIVGSGLAEGDPDCVPDGPKEGDCDGLVESEPDGDHDGTPER